MPVKRQQGKRVFNKFNKESAYEISIKLVEKFSRDITYSSQIVFFSNSCIAPVSLALYVRYECLIDSHAARLLEKSDLR